MARAALADHEQGADVESPHVAEVLAGAPQADLEAEPRSPDRQSILVTQTAFGNLRRLHCEQISLATGTVLTSFSLSFQVDPIEYTRPRGDSFLALGLTSPVWVYRYDLTGHLQRALTPKTLTPKTLLTTPLQAPNGSFLIAGTQTGLDRLTSNGVITRRIRIPAQVLSCIAVRRYDDHRFVPVQKH